MISKQPRQRGVRGTRREACRGVSSFCLLLLLLLLARFARCSCLLGVLFLLFARCLVTCSVLTSFPCSCLLGVLLLLLLLFSTFHKFVNSCHYYKILGSCMYNMYIYIYIYICIHIYTYIYIYICLIHKLSRAKGVRLKGVTDWMQQFSQTARHLQ